jgi:DNA-3-methyladenine glycosylase II
MTIQIPKPPLFSFDECLWFLDRRYDDCLHSIEGRKLRKAIVFSEPVLLQISDSDTHLIVDVLEGQVSQNEAIDYINNWFDLDRNLAEFYQLLQQDEALAHMVSDFAGLRLIAIPDLFEALCWSIIGQQINLTFAYALKRRLVEHFGQKITYQNIDYWLFPKPEVLTSLQVSDLQPFQFSVRKAEYLIGVAQLFANGSLSKTELSQFSTPDIIKKLTDIRGIGLWTANYALMKSLKRLECIPYGDVGLNNALVKLKGFPKNPSREQIDQYFSLYKGWESYLTFYVWRSLTPVNY